MTEKNVGNVDRHHHHFYRLALMIQVRHRRHSGFWHRNRSQFYELTPNQKVHIMTDVVVGHQIVNTIVYLDQHGQPMLVTPVPDAPPTWTNLADDTVDTMVVSPDGSTDTVTTVGAGADSLTVTVVVGGATFTAVEQINISAEPQVLTGVDIAAVVQ